MSESFDFPDPGRFTVGAIGEPGGRTFYFQVFADGTEVSVKCEKQQAQALADHLTKLLDDLPPADAPIAPSDALPPGDLAWIVGSISIGVDVPTGRVVVVLEEMPELGPDDEFPTDVATLRIRLTADQVRGFSAQAASLVAASRPLCRLCERPIDPSGHACPRLN